MQLQSQLSFFDVHRVHDVVDLFLKLRVQFPRAFQIVLRSGRVAFRLFRFTATLVRDGQVRIPSDRAGEIGDCSVQVALRFFDVSAVVVRVGIFWVQLDRAIVIGDRTVGIAF